MNQKSTFQKNLETAIKLLPGMSNLDVESCKFLLKPIAEKKGVESSKDDWMINAVLKNNRIDEVKSYNDMIRILSAGNSNYPLWINLKLGEENMIELEFSMRFRHIKTSHNQETGHPPFKLIDEE